MEGQEPGPPFTFGIAAPPLELNPALEIVDKTGSRNKSIYSRDHNVV